MGLPIRILHVVVNMNRGGAETLLMNLYRHIDKKLIQFDFLTFKQGVFDQEIKKLGGRIHRVPYVTAGGPFKFHKNLTEFFSTHSEYPIVHSHLDKMSGLVLKAAHKAGIPVRIAHSHNTRSEGGLFQKLYKSVVGAQIIKYSTDRFACSTAASKWLFGKHTSILLKNGIHVSDFSFNLESRNRVRRELNIPSRHLIIGHVGRFNEQKNHKFLVDVFKRIHELHPQSHLIVVGEGRLKDKIQKRVHDFKLDPYVHFLGLREDVPNLLQAFDVMLFPSLHEGLPLTLIEAQAANLPCLISDTITHEVDLGLNLIAFEGLGKDLDVWAKKTLNLTKPKTNDEHIYKFKQSGYDIQDSAALLQKFYLLKGSENLSHFSEEQGVI